jgi:CheY-like chemotaxis protein
LSNGRILVIAPNPDFRRSLAFALETEGYAVSAQGDLRHSDTAGTYDAVVLDHKAAKGPRDAVLAFCRDAQPVVLLAGHPQPWLLNDIFRAVPTPLVGGALSQAVADAVVTGRARPHAH